MREFERLVKAVKLLESIELDHRMILNGFIRRNGKYVQTKNLKNPLTSEEQNRIRRAKARPFSGEMIDRYFRSAEPRKHTPKEMPSAVLFLR